MAPTQYKDGIKFAEGRKILIITVQPIEVFDKLQRDGIVSGDWGIIKDRIVGEFGDIEQSEDYGTFTGSYKWLKSKMKDSGVVDLAQDSSAFFGWCQSVNHRRAIADLRHIKTYIPKGELGVILTLAIPEDRVMLTDFNLWHCVLNNFSANEDDVDDQRLIVSSWDSAIYQNDEFFQGRYKDASIQATFFNIVPDDVVSVGFFQR